MVPPQTDTPESGGPGVPCTGSDRVAGRPCCRATRPLGWRARGQAGNRAAETCFVIASRRHPLDCRADHWDDPGSRVVEVRPRRGPGRHTCLRCPREPPVPGCATWSEQGVQCTEPPGGAEASGRGAVNEEEVPGRTGLPARAHMSTQGTHAGGRVRAGPPSSVARLWIREYASGVTDRMSAFGRAAGGGISSNRPRPAPRSEGTHAFSSPAQAGRRSPQTCPRQREAGRRLVHRTTRSGPGHHRR